MSKHKEEIQADPLLITYANAIHYYKANTTLVHGIAMAFFALIAVIVGWSVYSAKQEVSARGFMVSAEQAFVNKDYNTALYGDGSTINGFMAISTNYGFTDSGNLASYYAAVSASQLNEFDAALGFIRKFNVPKGVMGVGAIGLEASILESLGRYEEAAKSYKKAASWDVNDSTTPSFLVKAANAALKAGKPALANQYAKEVTGLYSTSPSVTQAQQIIGRASL